MNIEKKKLRDLIPAEYNPRKDLKPGDPEFEKLKRSLDEFGYVEPIIWNKQTGRIVGGHQRAKAMMNLGITEADVVVIDFNEEKEKGCLFHMSDCTIPLRMTAPFEISNLKK